MCIHGYLDAGMPQDSGVSLRNNLIKLLIQGEVMDCAPFNQAPFNKTENQTK